MLSLYFFDLLLLPSGLGGLFISWCEAPFMWVTRARKIKIFALFHWFHVNFLTCCCCPQGWGPCLFHDVKQPFMRVTQARINSKSLFFFTDSMFIFWLAATALGPGGPAYFMMWSTPSCKQQELENFKIFALFHWFHVYFLTSCCCPQGWVAVYFMVQSTPSCEQRKLEQIKK